VAQPRTLWWCADQHASGHRERVITRKRSVRFPLATSTYLPCVIRTLSNPQYSTCALFTGCSHNSRTDARSIRRSLTLSAGSITTLCFRAIPQSLGTIVLNYMPSSHLNLQIANVMCSDTTRVIHTHAMNITDIPTQTWYICQDFSRRTVLAKRMSALSCKLHCRPIGDRRPRLRYWHPRD
jgi:hypothetical protein